jgi:hypothetical protein
MPKHRAPNARLRSQGRHRAIRQTWRCVLTDRRDKAPARFWVQRYEPDVVEGTDHPVYVLLRAVHQVRDVWDGQALR